MVPIEGVTAAEVVGGKTFVLAPSSGRRGAEVDPVTAWVARVHVEVMRIVLRRAVVARRVVDVVIVGVVPGWFVVIVDL